MRVFYVDNGTLMLTQYGTRGNQPRMKIDPRKSSDTAFVFTYVDATNVKSEKDPRMHDLTLTFEDRDHFSQEWILPIEGKNTSTVYDFARVKPAEQSSGW